MFPQHPSAFYKLLIQHHNLISDSGPMSPQATSSHNPKSPVLNRVLEEQGSC